MIVLALRIENGYGIRQFFVGHMVVADDKVDAKCLCVSDFINSFDAAVEYDNEVHARFCSKVNTFH